MIPGDFRIPKKQSFQLMIACRKKSRLTDIYIAAVEALTEAGDGFSPSTAEWRHVTEQARRAQCESARVALRDHASSPRLLKREGCVLACLYSGLWVAIWDSRASQAVSTFSFSCGIDGAKVDAAWTCPPARIPRALATLRVQAASLGNIAVKPK